MSIFISTYYENGWYIGIFREGISTGLIPLTGYNGL